MLAGRQCVVVISEGVTKMGSPTAKIQTVTKPMVGQNVVAPAKKGAAAPAATKQTTRRAAARPVDVEDGSEITDADLPF